MVGRVLIILVLAAFGLGACTNPSGGGGGGPTAPPAASQVAPGY